MRRPEDGVAEHPAPEIEPHRAEERLGVVVEEEEGDRGQDLGEEKRQEDEEPEALAPAPREPHHVEGHRDPERGRYDGGEEREPEREEEGAHERLALEEAHVPAKREPFRREGQELARVDRGQHHDDERGQQVGVDEDHDPEITDAAGSSAQAAPSGRGRAVRLARRPVRHAIPRMAREVSRK